MSDPNLNGAVAGISIRSADTGQIIFEHNGNKRLKPASNMKLFTTSAALSLLGSNHVFKTDVLTNGFQKWKVLYGNLYLKGKGDPTLLKSDFDKLAVELHRRGIRIISGDLIADDSWYDKVRNPIDMPWSDETHYYGAQISALTASPNSEYDTGSIIVKLTAGKRLGDKATYTLVPETDYVTILNKTKTVTSQSKKTIAIYRKHGTNKIIIEGSMPLNGEPITEWIAVHEPTRYALDLFKQSLEHHGIKVIGKSKQGITPMDAELIVTQNSPPLSHLVLPMMKLSNNTIAEILVKEMGKVGAGEGSWEKGLFMMKKELRLLGINTSKLVIRDGSGISHVNLIPANTISKLLYLVQEEKWFPVFEKSLPVAGIEDKLKGGTLRNRLDALKGNVLAKTGTLTTVSSLSGYLQTQSGKTYIFSIVLNNLLEEASGKNIEERILSIMAKQ